MSQTQQVGRPEQLGLQGEPCASCGAPLASDQRYCLNCGQRRAEPKVDYLRYLVPSAPAASAGEPAAAPPAGQAAVPTAGRQRDYTPLAAAGGIAVLGLMLLVGVLIGRGNEDSQPTAAAPQVVTVGEAATGAGASDTETAADTGGGSGAGGADTGKETGGGGKDTESTGGGGGGDLTAGGNGGESTDAPVEASTEDLEALQNTSPEDYADQSAELPDVIATPGEPPPIDNEAPGGGSSGTTIK